MSEADLPINERIALAIEDQWGMSPTDPRQQMDVQGGAAGDWNDAIDLAAGMARETSPWIAVGDGLPADGQHVIAWGDWPDHRVAMPWPARFAGGRFHDPVYGEALQGVIAWMVLPLPPLPTGGDR